MEQYIQDEEKFKTASEFTACSFIRSKQITHYISAIELGAIDYSMHFMAINREDMAANKEDMAPNKEDMAANEEDMATNEEDMAANKEDMAANKEDMAANKEDMAANKEDMAANKEDMAANKEDMAANKEDMAANKEDMAANKEDMAPNKEDMATNKEDMATNKEDMATNRMDKRVVDETDGSEVKLYIATKKCPGIGNVEKVCPGCGEAVIKYKMAPLSNLISQKETKKMFREAIQLYLDKSCKYLNKSLCSYNLTG